MGLIDCEITAFFLDARCSWLLLPWCLANIEVLVWLFQIFKMFCNFCSFLNVFFSLF